MISNYMNSSPSPFPSEDDDQNHQSFVPNYQSASSSSNSLSCHVFFNSSSTQDQTEFYPTMMYHPPHHQEDENPGGSYDLEKKDIGSKKRLKLTLWKNHEKQTDDDQEIPAKWMSSKMKNSAANKVEDQKQAYSSSSSFDQAADHLSSNSSSYNSNPPIRVCADCNTTKTPLWRSGPKGPKSLCNACGIRQRKARRAMAAAAANGTSLNTETAATLKIKVQNKEKIKNSVQFKKRCKLTSESANHNNAQQKQRKNVFEEFLVDLRKNLTFQSVFPQDEKEAAILLMALSCGLVHG